MPRAFRKKFKVGIVTAHVRYREKKGYEVRCQINKIKISVSGTTVDSAKNKFLQALQNVSIPERKAYTPRKQPKKILFIDYMRKWLQVVKEPSVKPITYKNYMQSFNCDILPSFSGKYITEIRQMELQEYFNQYDVAGKNRTAKKLYQLLAAVFEYAVNDGILERSPMKLIKIARYEQIHGVPLSREEEKHLIDLFINEHTPYIQAYVFLIYTGLRRSELKSVIISDGWITLISSKQRKGVREKKRSLPISPMLSKLLPLIDIEKIKTLYLDTLTNCFKEIFPNHHLHDLRHTFITRCQECGIQREVVSLWAGHAADTSITSTVYTHLEYNKSHQVEEMQKFEYDLK